LLSKKLIVAKSKEVKTRPNLAESSKEGYGSERVVLPMMMTISDQRLEIPSRFERKHDMHIAYSMSLRAQD
jgi:hypothetical protein